MSDTTAIDPDLGREVGIGEIEVELKKLWEEDDARTNASLINFAVYSEAPGSLRRNSAIISRMTRHHACRALLIGIDRAAPDAAIRAWITAHCHLSGGRRTICCEQVAFELKGRSVGRLRNTVFAHLASDLPLIFWWQGELSPLFEERLYSLIDRFIFDSSSWKSDPAGSFELLQEAMDTSTRELVVQDLAWTRTYHYRLAVAALFDRPQAQEALERIERVTVVAHPSHQVSALQLLAWFSTQAGWTVDEVRRESEAHQIRFRDKSGAAVEARIVFDESGAPLGRLEVSGGEVNLSVCRQPGDPHLFQELVAGETRFEAVSPADSDEDADLIRDQLARGGKNSLYRRALPRFIELLTF